MSFCFKNVLDKTRSWKLKYGKNGAEQERSSSICSRDHVNFGQPSGLQKSYLIEC